MDRSSKKSKGEKSRLTVFTENVIELLRLNPCLTQKSLKDYKNRTLKAKIIGEFALLQGVEVDTVQKKIHYIKDKFSDDFRKLCKATSGEGLSLDDNKPIKPSFPYFQSCLFLKDRINFQHKENYKFPLNFDISSVIAGNENNEEAIVLSDNSSDVELLEDDGELRYENDSWEEQSPEMSPGTSYAPQDYGYPNSINVPPPSAKTELDSPIMGTQTLEYYCVVPGCENSEAELMSQKLGMVNCVNIPRHKVRRFCTFPSNYDQCEKWVLAINIKQHHQNWRICDRHFESKDYDVNVNQYKVLNSNAVPSLYLPKVVINEATLLKKYTLMILEYLTLRYPYISKITFESVVNDKQLFYRMNNYCKVSHCRLSELDGVTLFEVPKSGKYQVKLLKADGKHEMLDLSKAWLKLANVKVNEEILDTLPVKICSEHFALDTCKIEYDVRGLQIELMENAFPTLNLVPPRRSLLKKTLVERNKTKQGGNELPTKTTTKVKKRLPPLKILPVNLTDEKLETFDNILRPLPVVSDIECEMCEIKEEPVVDYESEVELDIPPSKRAKWDTSPLCQSAIEEREMNQTAVLVTPSNIVQPPLATSSKPNVPVFNVSILKSSVKIPDDSSLNLQKYCRVCGMEDKTLVTIFSKENSSAKWEEIIEKHLHMKLDKNEVDMPQGVCTSCIVKLTQCDALEKTAKRAETAFRSRIKRWQDKQKEEQQQQQLELAKQTSDALAYIEMILSQQTVDTADSTASSNTVTKTPTRQTVKRKLPKVKIRNSEFVKIASKPIGNEKPKNSIHIFKCNLCEYTNNQAISLSLHIFIKHNKLSCGICLEIFQNFKQLENHKKKEHCIISCNTCDKTFVHKQLFKEHVLKMHSQYACGTCFQLFETSDEQTQHINNVHMTLNSQNLEPKTINTGVSCKLCDESFISTENLSEHLVSIHNANPIYSKVRNYATSEIYDCKICNMKLNGPTKLKKHYFWKHALYSCEVCFQLFDTCNEQIKHLDEVHMTPCPYCPEKNYTHRTFKRHVNKHKSKCTTVPTQISKTVDQIYECKYCNKGLSSKENVKRHYFWCHIKYACIICLEIFTNAQLEDKHIDTHGNICLSCESMFESEIELTEHVKSHPNYKPYLCINCGDRFTNKEELNIHVKIHEVKATLLCETCGKNYKTKAVLAAHIYTHTKSMLECYTCHKKYLFKSELESHIISSHTQEKAYKCLDCGSSFSLPRQLNKHMGKHKLCDVQQRITCRLCKLRFTRSEVKLHVNQIHNETYVYKCGACEKLLFVSESEMLDHINIHSTEELLNCQRRYYQVRVFTCELCTQYFVTDDELQAHLKRHMSQLKRFIGNEQL